MIDFEERKKIYKEYLQTPEWKLLSGYARYRNKEQNNGVLTCEDCGKTTGQFDVHHWMYPNSRDYCNDDNPKYHVVLCHRCHGVVHKKVELSEKEEQERREIGRNNMKLAMAKYIVVYSKLISKEEADKLSDQECVELYDKHIERQNGRA